MRSSTIASADIHMTTASPRARKKTTGKDSPKQKPGRRKKDAAAEDGTIAPSRKLPARGLKASGLTRERIVAAAIEQIDRNGLMGFSLRDVARSLGVYPSAVYWYVPTREDLLAMVVEHAMTGIAPEPGNAHWMTWLRELFTNFRMVMKKHPNIAPLVGGQLVANSSLSPQMVDRILAVLIDAGCKEEHIVELYNVIVAALAGFSTLEFASTPLENTDKWSEQLQAKIHEIRALEYPTLARHLPAMANRSFIMRWQSGVDAPMDSSFQLYLDVVMAGIEQNLQRLR